MVYKPKFLIGIDEVGRGPLAGPIMVVGVKIKRHSLRSKIFSGIKDSKKLSAKQRDLWFSFLSTHPKLEWAVAMVYPKVIDRINISAAGNLASWRVYKKLVVGSLGRYKYKNIHISLAANNKKLSPKGIYRVLLDGGLRLPQGIPHRAIIKGDEKVPVIAAASIIAKVLRDRLMVRIDTKFPRYGFCRHKGYGTKEHIKALRKFGPVDIHRKSFLSFLEV
mgnify:CR=1 FL=1